MSSGPHGSDKFGKGAIDGIRVEKVGHRSSTRGREESRGVAVGRREGQDRLTEAKVFVDLGGDLMVAGAALKD
jgi:hypothetical protein